MAASTKPACDCAVAIIKYVNMRLEKLPSHMQASFIDGQFSQLVQHVRMQTELTHEDAMALIGVISHDDSPFTTDHVNSMGQVTDELLNKSGHGASSAQGASQCQEHRYMHNYLGSETWDMLRGQMSINHKLEKLCRHMVSTCFLRNPDEVTRRDLVALVYRASAMDVDGAKSLEHVQRVRAIMRSIRALDHGPKGPKTYPADPMTFHSMHPSSKILEHDPPIVSPIDAVDLSITQKEMPMRNTHKSVKRHAPSDGRPEARAQPGSSDDRLTELTKFILGHGMSSNLQAITSDRHWLHSPNAEPPSRSRLKHEPPATPAKSVAPATPASGVSPPSLMDHDQPRSHAHDSQPLDDLMRDLEPVTGDEVLPHAEPRPHVYGSLDHLRTMVDERFKGHEQPSASSGAHTSSKHAAMRMIRLRKKSPPSAMYGGAKVPMTRPASQITSDGWTVNHHMRMDGSDKAYKVYVAPSGKRYHSLKQASLNGVNPSLVS